MTSMENHKNHTFTLRKVATKYGAKGQYLWCFAKDKKDKDNLKQQYKLYPKRFTSIEGILYFKEINKKRLEELRVACLEIAGNSYVLALDLTSWKKDQKSMNLYKVILQKESNHYEKSLELFEKYERYLKLYGIACGVIVDDEIRWFPNHIFTGYKPHVLRKYWERDSSIFCEVQKVLYYLKPKNSLIEELFFEACKIAGGEKKLATALGKNQKEILNHQGNFERMRFKKRKNFVYYSRLLAHYIESSQNG